jgi:hypothetical protein
MATMLIIDLQITFNLLLGEVVACEFYHCSRSKSLIPIFGTTGGQSSYWNFQNSVYYVDLASKFLAYNPVAARLAALLLYIITRYT